MPYLLVGIAAVIMAVGFAKAGRPGRPSKVPWVLLFIWAMLLVTGISIWITSVRG